MNEYHFVCVSCDEELTFRGNDSDAEALCPNCGVVSVIPEELFRSADDEQRMDAARDDRLMS